LRIAVSPCNEDYASVWVTNNDNVVMNKKKKIVTTGETLAHSRTCPEPSDFRLLVSYHEIVGTFAFNSTM